MGTAKRSARERARALIAEQRRAQQRRRRLMIAGSAVAAVLAVAVVLIVIKVAGGTKSTTSAQPEPSGSAAAAIAKKVTTVPASVLDQVGKGKGVTGTPKPLSNEPALTADNKPLVLYIGAEYCPYCAAERWSVVVALSRFGTFSNLGFSHSASDDVFPNTATLSFHGSSYKSDYLTFQGLETQTNVKQDGQYTKLDPLTPAQEQVLRKYDSAPYVDSNGAIPFLDMGNKFVMSGAGFGPEVLKGLTADQIADALSNPQTDLAQAVLGDANSLTADICQLTGNQPAAVCTGAAATAYSGGKQ